MQRPRRAALRSARRMLGLGLLALGLTACDGLLGDGAGQEDGLTREEASRHVTAVVGGLDTPWEVRFLPDGDLLVTQRPGRMVRVAVEEVGGEGDVVETHPIPDVRESGEGGLMGLALHPDFASTRWLYLCFTGEGSDGLENRVVRYRYREALLSERTVILDGMDAASFHDGCRLEFGPGGHLYVTMGDAGRQDEAQDSTDLSGKILRLTDDGGIPADNPFGNAVYSYGHRNPQGLAFDAKGRLWSTEHGPSGFPGGRDELNLVQKGANHGWPEIRGGESEPGMREPVLQSGIDVTWAPAGLAFLDGSLFFGGLRGRSLYEARLSDGGVARLLVHFQGDFGRIRAVRMSPDGALYFTTSNRDGRGDPGPQDDRVVRVEAAAFGG